MSSFPRDDNRIPVIGGVDSSTFTTPTTIAVNPSTHALKTEVSGAGSGGTSSTDHDAFTAGTTAGTPAMGVYEASPSTLTDGQLGVMELDSTRSLKVHITANDAGSTGGTALTDDAAFTAGTTSFTPTGGVYNDAVAAATLGHADTVRISQNRGMHVNLRNNAGTELATSSNPLQVSLANTAANSTAVKVDNSGVTQPVSGTVTVQQSTASNLKVDLSGTAANTTALKVDGSAVTQPISAASLPLPSGAATAAKQPALGTAGSASTDVITVQGIASMTALKVDGSAVTQPVSGTFWQSTQPVSLASLPALAAGTNTIGNIDIQDASGNGLTSNSTTFTAKHALDTNLLGTLGTAFSTAGKVDVKAADGDVFIRQATASNLNATVVGTGTFTVQAQESGTWNVGLNAGSNLVGKVGIDQTTPGTTNAVTPVPASNSGWSFSYQSALTNSTAQIKGSAGTFGGWAMLFNPNTATTYIQVFNKASASVTLGSTVPDFVIPLPGIASASATGLAANWESVHGIAMSTGITVAATTTASGSTAPANAVVGTFLYK